MQPTSGFQKTSISAGPGTAVIKNISTYFKRVIIPGTYTGTIQFDDASTAAGTTSTSNFLTLGIPATNYPRHIDIDINCANGLVYQATGTPVLTIVWN